jgi:hypothetical protein
MTEKTLDEIKEWALHAVEISTNQMKTTTGNNHAISGGHYEMAVDLCAFLGIEDQIKEE